MTRQVGMLFLFLFSLEFGLPDVIQAAVLAGYPILCHLFFLEVGCYRKVGFGYYWLFRTTDQGHYIGIAS